MSVLLDATLLVLILTVFGVVFVVEVVVSLVFFDAGEVIEIELRFPEPGVVLVVVVVVADVGVLFSLNAIGDEDELCKEWALGGGDCDDCSPAVVAALLLIMPPPYD